jgi:cytochrome c
MRSFDWIVFAAALGAGCGEPPMEGVRVAGGEAERGRRIIVDYGCGACHTIPGVRGARGLVAAPLTEWSQRRYIAGALVNEPDNLIQFIVSPESIEPGTAMPNLGLSHDAARDIAAYLYTLGAGSGLGPAHPFPVRWLNALMPGRSSP